MDQVASILVSSMAPFCGVTPPGVALGSKSAEVVAVDPGGCAPSGGEPLGELLPARTSEGWLHASVWVRCQRAFAT